MAIAAPVAKLRQLAQALPLGEGEGNQGGPPLDTKTDEQVTAPPLDTKTDEQVTAPPASTAPTNWPDKPIEAKTPDNPVETKTTDKGPPANWPDKPVETKPPPVETKPPPVEAKAPPADWPDKPIQPPATQAASGATPSFTPPEAEEAQHPIAEDQPAGLPYVPAPMPSGTGVSAPQGSTTDPHDQIAALVAQGLSSGAAQAIIAGQTPKTISGDKPSPPKQPKVTAPPIDNLGQLGDEDLVNQALADKPAQQAPKVQAPDQQPPLDNSGKLGDEDLIKETEAGPVQPPAAPTTTTRTAPPAGVTQKTTASEFGWVDRAAVAAHPDKYPSGNKGFPDFGAVDLSGENTKGVSLPPEDINARMGRNVMTRDAKGIWHADPDFAADVRSGKIQIEVTNPATNKTAMAPLVDIGPDKAKTKAGLDVLHGTAQELGFTSGKAPMNYRIAGATPTQSIPSNPQPKDVAAAAVSNVGHLNTTQDPGTNGGELACADAVSRIVRYQMGIDLPNTLSTADMYTSLQKDWKEVPPNTPGAIIISPTTGSQHGHVGIVGPDGKTVYSNSSRTGEWSPNYTTDSWTKYFSSRGLEVHAFVPGPNVGHLTAEQLAAERASGGGSSPKLDTSAGAIGFMPMIPTHEPSGNRPSGQANELPGPSGGDTPSQGRGPSEPKFDVNLGSWSGGRGGDGEEASASGGGTPPRYQPQQMNVDTSQADPMVAALTARGFTPVQALNYAQSLQNVASAKGLPPISVKGPAPPAPSPATPLQLSLSSKQPVTPQLLSAKQLMPGKVTPIAPGPRVDPSVVLGLMKKGFTREQAIAVAGKATVTPGIGQAASFRPAPAAPGKTVPTGPAIQLGPAPAAPQKPPAQAPQKPVPQKPASDMPPQRQVETPAPKKQAPEPEPTEFTGRPAGSTHGNPNPPGMEALTGSLKDQSHQHKALLSEDDPRVTRQKDNLIKGEHFVEGDPYHENLLGGLPYGKGGPQHEKIKKSEQAIADDQPMHISYISSPKEAEKFPTRESRKTQYEKSSPEARLMKATEGALVGHSMIPLNVGVKLPTKAEEKEGETHQGYTQGISTNVMANNFQHINDKLEAMGRKTPYPKLGAKFANDLEGYYSNLLAGHTATGRSYAQGTDDHPNEPDREHVPYKLTRKEADFINLVINNTSAFASHDDAKKIRELARTNGTLITEKGETNRLAHDIEQIDPGWHGRDKGGHGRVLEPSIKTFKTGLIHEIHPTEQHLPDTIRPGKEYQLLTKALARTSARGRPDVAIGASLHHTFQDNKKINEIERDFSDHKIDEGTARSRLQELGEDPDDYRYVGGSGGLITPYEDDPEALTPEEHTQMKDNLRQSWVSGKMNVEDYRKKSAEVPLPSRPSKPAVLAPKPVKEAPKLPESETPEPSASLTPAPKPAKPKLGKLDPVKPAASEEPEEKPETPPAAPLAPPVPKPQPKPKAPEPEEASKQIEPSRVKNSYAASGDKVHWLPTDDVDKRWQDRDKDLHIPPGGTKNTIGKRYQGAKEYLQGDQPVNAPRAHVDEKGGVSFIDGRHRFAAMRDMGHEKVPIALTEDAHENAAKTGLTESEEAPKKAPAPDEPLPAVKPKKASKPAPPKPAATPEPEVEEKLTKPAGAADKAWMKDPGNEAERQAYLEKRVAASIGRQNTHPSAIPLKVQRNEAGGVQHDPQLNPVWEKTDYNIADTPFLQKHGKGLSQLEGADKHEDTLGENEHKHLIDVERKRLSAMRNASAVHTMGDHIVNSYNKIKDIPEIAAGKGWYSRMRDKMAKVFGAGEEGKASEDHELFAQLLGATSAKTPVRDNFIQALDAFEQYKAGKFDRHIAKYKEAYQAMQDGGYEALNQKMREQGLKDEDGNLRQGKSDADAMAHWIDHHKIRPLKQNGAKYNSNSDQVLKVLSGTWLKEVGAPKTPNFAGNLTGRTLAATIDVWAARHLHRIAHEHDGEKKGWRPQSSGEPGVNSLDFAFSQDAMKHAADKIGINPDDLQAILWYAEKQHYDKHGWTGAQGAEKGSFDETWDKAFPTEGKAMTSQALQKHYQDEKARDDKLDDLRSKVAEKRGKGESQEKVEKYMKRYADEFLGKHGYTREHLEAPPAAPGLEEEAA